MPKEQIKDPEARIIEAKPEPELTKTAERVQRAQALRRKAETEPAERLIRSLSRPASSNP